MEESYIHDYAIQLGDVWMASQLWSPSVSEPGSLRNSSGRHSRTDRAWLLRGRAPRPRKRDV